MTRGVSGEEWAIIWQLIGAFVGTGVASAGLAWWLATRFNNIYKFIGSVKEAILSEVSKARDILTVKLEEHEKHDNTRFAEIERRFTQQDLAIMRLEIERGLNPSLLRGVGHDNPDRDQ